MLNPEITKDISDSRRAVAITAETNTKLKNFAKHNTLKVYELVDSMIDVISEDPELSKKVIQLTKARAKIKQEAKQVKRDAFSNKLNNLSPELQNKLMGLSADDLAALLEKAGL